VEFKKFGEEENFPKPAVVGIENLDFPQLLRESIVRQIQEKVMENPPSWENHVFLVELTIWIQKNLGKLMIEKKINERYKLKQEQGIQFFFIWNYRKWRKDYSRQRFSEF